MIEAAEKKSAILKQQIAQYKVGGEVQQPQPVQPQQQPEEVQEEQQPEQQPEEQPVAEATA